MLVAMDPKLVEAIDGACRGSVFLPGRPGYDAARRLFNGMIDRYPAAIARCVDSADVASVVRLARAKGLELSVRGGGHGVSGQALADGVLTIDLSALKTIAVDPEARLARVGAGVTWGELDPATQAHGLAVTGGRVASTGVGGLTLGSGSGWLERTIGFTCDNLVAAEVVLADGSIVRADGEHHQELLWGLKGGGGNFGIVTEFTFGLHPIGPEIVVGGLIHDFADAASVLKAYDAAMKAAPDALGGSFSVVTLPDQPTIPQAVRGRLAAIITAAWFGPLDEAEAALAPLRSIGRPLADTIARRSYCWMQTMNEGGNPWGLNNYYKADFLQILDDDAIAAFIREAARISSPDTALILQPLGGALARVPVSATPLARRDAAYAYHALSVWRGRDHERHIAWTRGFAEAMRPFSVPGVYLTYMGEDHEQRVREAYGPGKYERLVALKDRYDPDNVFHRNPNIRPSSASRGATDMAAAVLS